nr:hypothetical protein CFP56_61139 [Quercus suber]
MTVFSVDFKIIPMWIQVWGLSFDLINDDIGKDIELPLDKPIRRGALVLSPEGDKVWIAFKYERLLGMCYNCGKFGLEERDCPLPNSSEHGESQYGEWLSA